MSRIAVVVGSLRAESYNRQVAEAMTRLPAAEGHAFTFPAIGDLPLYNQDDDAHQAEPVRRLESEISAARGLLFVTAEYSCSLPGVLKNAIATPRAPMVRTLGRTSRPACWGFRSGLSAWS
jgi:chromate reductase